MNEDRLGRGFSWGAMRDLVASLWSAGPLRAGSAGAVSQLSLRRRLSCLPTDSWSRPGYWFITALLYLGAAELGLSLAIVNNNVSAVWPPSGVSLALLLIFGGWLWPGVAAGAFVTTWLTGASFATAFGISIGATLEAVLGALLVRSWCGAHGSLMQASRVVKFVVAGVLVSTVVAASVGTGTLILSEVLPRAMIREVWWTWWLGGAVGVLVVTPAVLAWATPVGYPLSVRQSVEAVLLTAALITVGGMAFGGWLPSSTTDYPLAFALLSLLFWSAFRFQQRGATLSILLVSGICIWGTVNGSGPFVRDDLNESLLWLQGFIGVIAITTLVLSAVLDERDRADRASRQHQMDLDERAAQRTQALSDANLNLNREVLQRRRAEEQLQRERDFVSAVLDTVGTLVLVLDRRGLIVSFNRACERLTGYRFAEVRGQCVWDFLLPQEEVAAVKAVFDDLRSGHFPSQYENDWLTRDGLRRSIAWSNTAMVDDHDTVSYVIATGTDITEKKRSEERIYRLAHYDVLTNLPNRALFQERLERSTAQAQRLDHCVGILFIDLDGFKLVNDTLGHPAGDRLLVTVAQRLLHCVRKADTVSRWGGDEFAVILTQIGRYEDAAVIAQKILAVLTPPLVLEGREVFVGASIGISVYPADGGDADTLVRNADTAMYRAKELGKDNYQFFAAEMNARAQERLALENNLRRALERDEFSISFRPRIDSRSGAIVAAEALLQRRGMQTGVTPTVNLLPLAEQTGLLLPVSERLLRAACSEVAGWPHGKLSAPRIAVNVCGRRSWPQDLVETVRQVLDETGFDAHRLDLEFSELVLIGNLEQAAVTLRGLKALGIEIVVTGFGTGYSFLNDIQRLPIDKLKIDLSFVGDRTKQSDDAALIEGMVAMARGLDFSVIVEGGIQGQVPAFTGDTVNDQVQGLVPAKPLTAEEFQSLLS